MKEQTKAAGKVLSPLKAIRARCLDCVCGQYMEVKLCPCSDCPLWPYRMGRRPDPPAKTGGKTEGSIFNA